MTKLIETPKTQKEKRRVTQQWLASCALEGIVPTQETLAEIQKFIESGITPQTFITHLKHRYGHTASSKAANS